MLGRVLVTRPEPGASATVRKLEAAGFEPVLLPLSRTAPIGATELPNQTDFDAVALTSANAARYAGAERIARIAGLPCLTVGGRTGQAARDAGMADVRSADGDAADLAKLIAASMPAGSRILYICGRTRRPILEEALAAGGYAVTLVESYRTEPLHYNAEGILRHFGSQSLDAVLLYSPFSAERFSAFAEEHEVEEWLGRARLLCLSQQVARALSGALRTNAEIAAAPDEKSLFALLGRAN